VQIRRELLDLARRCARRHQETETEDDLSGLPAPTVDLDSWCRFHEAVEQLPVLEREVVSLLFYHGWTWIQVAELLGVSERTVRRHRGSACLALNQQLGGQLPSF
jgi:RNA polymerase sigma factor (sigma-70 family)